MHVKDTKFSKLTELTSWHVDTFGSLPALGSVWVASDSARVQLEPDQDHITETVSDRYVWSAPEHGCAIRTCTNEPHPKRTKCQVSIHGTKHRICESRFRVCHPRLSANSEEWPLRHNLERSFCFHHFFQLVGPYSSFFSCNEKLPCFLLLSCYRTVFLKSKLAFANEEPDKPR